MKYYKVTVYRQNKIQHTKMHKPLKRSGFGRPNYLQRSRESVRCLADGKVSTSGFFLQLRSLIWKCYNSPMPCDLSGKMSYLQVQLLFWQLSFECVSSEVLICNPQGLLIVLLLVSEGFDSDIWTLKHPMWIR